jgi:hypothetical protein
MCDRTKKRIIGFLRVIHGSRHVTQRKIDLQMQMQMQLKYTQCHILKEVEVAKENASLPSSLPAFDGQR